MTEEIFAKPANQEQSVADLATEVAQTTQIVTEF